MTDWLEPPQLPPLTGDERFGGVDASVRDFWAFAMSDLRTNNVRGYLAEFLVARAVGAGGPRVEWDAYDVVTPSGVTVEVKSAAYLQRWRQQRLSSISFGSLRARTWTPEAGYAPEADYHADAYVFALHTARAHDELDPLELSQWRFHVLGRQAVAATSQSSIGLATLARLGAVEVAYDELAAAIEAAAVRQRP